jgi:FdhD protein
MTNSLRYPFTKTACDGSSEEIERAVAVEMPVAVEFNGIGYAVMMMTPADLEDFAYGFALSEALIDAPDDVIDVDTHEIDAGIVLRVTLSSQRIDRVTARVRHRVSESSCGLCGIENLEQALRPIDTVTSHSDAHHPAIFAALDQLGEHQPLSAQTGAVHAAALCSAMGDIRLVREDVGRHNAFDKLIGAMMRAGLGWDAGFGLLTARCSYELVEKAARANCPLLATISAPTSLAIDRAQAAGLRLISLARRDTFLTATTATPRAPRS